jgi:hypothetical protein
LGVTYNFDGSVGVSLKVLSTNKEDRGAVAAGVTFFPRTNKFGIDVGAGYVFRNAAVTLGWDFLNSNPQIALGYVNTQHNDPITQQSPVNLPVVTPAATPTPVAPPVVAPPVPTPVIY